MQQSKVIDPYCFAKNQNCFLVFNKNEEKKVKKKAFLPLIKKN